MSKFEVSLRYELEEGVEVDLVVSGDYDDGAAQFLKVFNTKGCRLPGVVERMLTIDDHFVRAVESKVRETL